MLEVDPDPEMDPDPVVDSDPAWIRIHAIPIPALLNAILAPDLDPQKSGIITPLNKTPLNNLNSQISTSYMKWETRNGK